MRQKALYDIGEMPPPSGIPKSSMLYAQLILQSWFGDPIR